MSEISGIRHGSIFIFDRHIFAFFRLCILANSVNIMGKKVDPPWQYMGGDVPGESFQRIQKLDLYYILGAFP